MKYPKYKLAFPGKHVWVFKGHPMTQFDGYTLGTYASGNGVVSADKTKGYYGESATLYHDENEYTTFLGFSSTIGTIDGDTYVFGRGDDVVSGYFSAIDPYNPLGLPDYTIRLKYKDNVTPTFKKGVGVQVSQSPNIWDLTYTNNNWGTLLELDDDLLEIMGANSKYVTDIARITQGCDNLSSVALFDTSNVTGMFWSFASDTKLSSIPQFNTKNVINMVRYFFKHSNRRNSFT